MLAVLLEIPRDANAWNRFSWHHRSSHTAIRQAILAKGGPNLPEYQLDPINPSAFKDFLQANQQSHIDMLGSLGIQSSDIQDVDITKENELISWTFLHYQDHYSAEKALGL